MFELDRFLRLSIVDQSLEDLVEIAISLVEPLFAYIDEDSIVEEIDHCSKVDRESSTVRPRCKGLGAL